MVSGDCDHVPLCQDWNPVVGNTRENVLRDREQVSFLHRNRNALQDGGKYTMPCRDCDPLFLDALALLLAVALQLLR